jgi:hypothetical protein
MMLLVGKCRQHDVILAHVLFVTVVVHAASSKNKHHPLLIVVDGLYANVWPKIKVYQKTFGKALRNVNAKRRDDKMKSARCHRPHKNREKNSERREATRKPNAHDDRPRALKFEAKIAWRPTSMRATTWGGEK